MSTIYSYELWNGKEVVGYFNALFRVQGTHVIIPTISEYKREYGRTCEKIKVPISSRVLYYNGIDTYTRIVLDVRKKSQRQIDIIKLI